MVTIRHDSSVSTFNLTMTSTFIQIDIDLLTAHSIRVLARQLNARVMLPRIADRDVIIEPSTTVFNWENIDDD
jgi:hypothetical protein